MNRDLSILHLPQIEGFEAEPLFFPKLQLTRLHPQLGHDG